MIIRITSTYDVQGAAVKRVLRNRKGILNRTTLALSNCQNDINPENIKKKITQISSFLIVSFSAAYAVSKTVSSIIKRYVPFSLSNPPLRSITLSEVRTDIGTFNLITSTGDTHDYARFLCRTLFRATIFGWQSGSAPEAVLFLDNISMLQYASGHL